VRVAQLCSLRSLSWMCKPPGATTSLEVAKPTPSMAPLPPSHTLTVRDPQRLDSRAAFGDLLDVPLQLHIIARPIRRRHIRKTVTPLTEEELEDLQVGLYAAPHLLR
jgi:hypothetical protein